MRILNPLYDASFKYLFQDTESAKLLLEVIVGQQIVNLETIGQEYFRLDDTPNEAPPPDGTVPTEPAGTTSAPTDPAVGSAETENPLRLNRLDFVCRIREASGRERICLIEVQRGYARSEIPRFRRYVGFHYESNYNVRDGDALEIMSLYFLGKNDPDLGAFPLVKVARKYIDLSTGTEITNVSSKFVERLTHEMFLVNVRALERHQNTLPELVLQIFNQSHMNTDNKGVTLEINPEDYPEKYRRLLERLRVDGARRNPVIDLVRMEAEREAELYGAADMLEKLKVKHAELRADIEEQKKVFLSAKHELEASKQEQAALKRQQIEAEQQRTEAEQRRTEAEQQRAEAEQQRAEAEQRRLETEQKRIEAEQKLSKALRTFQSLGMTLTEAAQALDLTEAEAQRLLDQ